jgi:hypothetical protein
MGTWPAMIRVITQKQGFSDEDIKNFQQVANEFFDSG